MPTRDPLDTLHEQLLVMRSQAGDRAAFQDLVRRYDRRVAYYARRMLGDAADALEVAQEIWLKVFQRLPSLRSPAAFRVWLYKIAHDLVVTHWRKTDRERHRDDRDVPAEATEWNEFELLENAELVHRGLARLSPWHREVLTLRFLESLDLSEIADVIGCPPGTVRSRLHYALQALREQIAGDHHAGP